MFEIELNENYEDNYEFRNQERAERDAKDRENFRKNLSAANKSRSMSNSIHK